MFRVWILLTLVCLPLPTVSSEEVDLSRGWRFKPGDSLAWSRLDTDDSGWQRIDVGKPWEEQGYAKLDGFAWYRTKIVVPGALRQQDAFVATRSLLFELGQVDLIGAGTGHDVLVFQLEQGRMADF